MYNIETPQRSELPSAATLLRSTAIAFLVAATLLVVAVVPAEYGIDPTGVGRVLGLTEMGEIKRRALASETAAPSARAGGAATTTSVQAAAPSTKPPPPAATPPAKSDQASVTLKPGEGAEIKLQMEKGATVEYRWVTHGGPVNFDAHGEASAARLSVSYKKGRGALQDEGTLGNV